MQKFAMYVIYSLYAGVAMESVFILYVYIYFCNNMYKWVKCLVKGVIVCTFFSFDNLHQTLWLTHFNLLSICMNVL